MLITTIELMGLVMLNSRKSGFNWGMFAVGLFKGLLVLVGAIFILACAGAKVRK
jgi:ABC-type polysaccharide/polyol phosphate export permease